MNISDQLLDAVKVLRSLDCMGVTERYEPSTLRSA